MEIPVDGSEKRAGAQAGPLRAGRVGRWRARWRIPLPRLGLSTSERVLILGVVDVLVLNGALLVALALRFDYPLTARTLFQAPIYFVLLTVVWLVWAVFFDCYDLPRTAVVSPMTPAPMTWTCMLMRCPRPLPHSHRRHARCPQCGSPAAARRS